MPTARSWTEVVGENALEVRHSLTDLRSMLAFRGKGLNPLQARRLRLAGLVVLTLTIATIVVPAYLNRALDGRRVGDLILAMPSIYLAFLALTIISAVASGGGREVIPREQAVAFPVSTWTEHFGALLLAPLNIAWLLQSWTLLALTSYVLGPTNLWASTIPILLWIAVATVVGQAAGWLVEGVRRGKHGRTVTRVLTVISLGLAGWLVAAGAVTDVLDRAQTTRIFILAAYGTAGSWGPWTIELLQLAVVGAFFLVLGGLIARWALHRPQREESRLDSGTYRPWQTPASDLVAMVRVDRASIWRSVPLRRGIIVLALMPGLVAAAGSLRWDLVTILPGLVASGGALLFGVNAWCLDGRGALWRESLPAAPGLAFTAKALVLFELLLVAAGVTIVLAGLRAGAPTGAELSATVCAALTVSVAVVSGALRWSVSRPFAVDMRSARATPAPPVVMVGYSTRLALVTTFLGLLFSGLALAPDWRYPVALAVPLLLISGARLRRTYQRWLDPQVRSRVIATVAS